MTAQYVYFIIFACLGYLIVTDKSVAQAFYLCVKIARQKLQVMKWWIMNDPSTPWVRYMMWRRSLRLAKELMDELKSNAK
jgi:hypothetical protein